MSKTLLNITLVAAAIAVNVIPGAGQAISATIVTAITSAGIAAGVSLGVAAFTKAPRPDNASTAIKLAVPPRFSAYGRGKYFGSYVLYTVSSDGYAVDVWAFHDGRVDAIEGYYLNDEPITLIGGFVQRGQDGRYGDNDTIEVGVNLGAARETPHGAVVARLPGIWTNQHRGDGVVSGYMISKPVKAKNYQEVYATGGPNQTPVAIVIRAQPVYDWRDPSQSLADPLSWRWSENFVLHLAHYQLVRNGKSWAKHFAPTLGFWTAAANDADLQIPLRGVQVTLAATAPAGATSVALSSVPSLSVGYTILIGASDDVSHGEPRVVSAISGNTVSFDLPLSWAHPAGSMVNWQADNGTIAESRYRSCVSHKHTDEHKSVIAALLACGDGWMAPRADGALVVYSGRYIAPTVTVGPDIIAAYGFERGVEDENAVNEIPLSYVSSRHDFNTVDADTWTDESDILSRGQVRSEPLANQVPSHSQARRLAKRRMAQVMAPARGTVTTTSAGAVILGQRYIHLRLAEGEGSAHAFVVYDGPAEITQLSRNLQTGAVSFSWIAADPNIDAWNPETEEGEPAPVGDVVAREPLDPPVITEAVADYNSDSGAGTAGVFLRLMVDGPDRSDLTWFLRTREQGSAIWGEREYSDIDAGSVVSLATEFVVANAMVEVEAAYGVGDGRISPWSSPTTVVNTSTENLPPAQASELQATGGAGRIIVDWRNPTSASFSYARLYRGRNTTFGDAVLVGGDRPGALGEFQSVTDEPLAPGRYYYWIRTFNAGGSGGAPLGPVDALAT